jgi:hypothetical protein
MKRIHPRRLAFTISIALLLQLIPGNASPAFGQATSSGTVVGTVTDHTGAVIANAAVVATDTTTKQKRSTVTNKTGQYVLVDIPPGTYDVTASFAGFSTDEISALTVSVGTQTTASFKLVVGAQTTTVQVTASNADLQTLNASTGTTVDPALTESMPNVNREVASFVTLQAGVSPGGNVAGTTTDQASFSLDGGNNTFDMDGTSSTYTTAFAPVQGAMPMPQDSMEEFKVSTTGQTADFNNSSGFQVQAITRRGHDKWTGTAYDYYLDSTINANSWQNNFPNETFTTSTPGVGAIGTTIYTAKPSYHYSRFGVAAGGPILPKLAGGKTYLFAMYEGFRYPQAATYERTIPSYAYLNQGLTFAGNLTDKSNPALGCTYNGATANTSTCSSSQLQAADPRHIGLDPTLANYYSTELPLAPASGTGSVGANGTQYAGTFDSNCVGLSASYCDGTNIIGYRSTVHTPENTDFFVARADHDFSAKWHVMASYRYFNFRSITNNQVDIGGVLSGDKIGVATAVAPRPQEPWYLVTGVTTNISPTLTNEFHYSFLRNYWNWKDANAPAQVAGAGGAIEPMGENTTTVLSPYNVNSQSIRTRNWDSKDNFFSDNVTKLKGNHLIQIGGQFQHNFYFFSRTDNGSAVNFTPTYQIGDTSGGGNIAYTGLLANGISAAGVSASARVLDTYYGMVTDTQVANTYSNTASGLTLNPPLTPVTGHASNPFYNIYVTDTWHARPTLSFNLGLSYAVEMPPQDRNGNESMLVDASGNPLSTTDFLAQRKAAALQGQIYNPEIGWAEIHNVNGNRKYPYNPYYGGVSPRVSAVWAPKFDNENLDRLFGHGGTAIRIGYSRIYGRVNGDAEILPLLAAPGLIVGTQCKYAQTTGGGGSACNQSNFTDSTAFRFGNTSQGEDGLSPVLASAAVTNTLPQPYHPGFDGPGIASSSGVDVSLRPNDVDTFNFSIQRQINRRMLVEVGYIGRLVHHEFNQVNPNSVPYMLSLNGQSFEAAYVAIETAFGCTTSASLCSTSTTPTNIAAQPFFESALGGPNSPFCSKYASCTAALLANATYVSDFRQQKVFSLWQGLDNNTNGAAASAKTPQFNFARSMMGTPTSNATFGSAGQVVSGMNQDVPNGYSNYNGGYVSFKASGWRGLTLQENFTYSKALGLQPNQQSGSGVIDVDNYNPGEQYGRQGFDQRIVFNTIIVYQTPWYSGQHGIIGRLAGGWTFSPVVTAATGAPLGCTTNNSGQSFGGGDGSNESDPESCIFTSGYNQGQQTHRGILGGIDTSTGTSISVGTAPHAGGTSAAVNMFTNPVAVWQSVRPLILGLDNRSGGAGVISGLPNLNLDLSVKKKLVAYEKYSLEFSGVLTNVLNHLDFANPSLSLQSSTSWGVIKTQGNTPRQIQMGVRAYF